jgi:succinate dehydrogenase/fumarate reductase subunit D
METKKIEEILKSEGAKFKDWYDVRETPERRPFAKELEYEVPGLFNGKVHLRNNGDFYIFIVSKDVFNWKAKVKELKLKGEVVDAAGGLMWIYEENYDWLRDDIKFLKDYIKQLSESLQHQKH